MGKKSQDLSGRNSLRISTPRPRAASMSFLLMAFRFYSGFTRIPLHYTSSPAPPFNPATFLKRSKIPHPAEGKSGSHPRRAGVFPEEAVGGLSGHGWQRGTGPP